MPGTRYRTQRPRLRPYVFITGASVNREVLANARDFPVSRGEIRTSLLGGRRRDRESHFLAELLLDAGSEVFVLDDLSTGARSNIAHLEERPDFHLVVVSAARHSALTVEKIEVDDNVDIIRRRRWKQSTYRKILP